MLTVCQTIYGRERGADLSAFLEKATGEPCPCSQGRTCPLLPPPPRQALDDAPAPPAV